MCGLQIKWEGCVQLFKFAAHDSFMWFITLCACLVTSDSYHLDYSLPGSSVQGIFHARILEWVAIFFSSEFSWPRDQICISSNFCIAGSFFTSWAKQGTLITD